MPFKEPSQRHLTKRAVVLSVRLGQDLGYASRQDEHCSLARSAGYEIVELITAKLNKPNSHTFIGKGKLAQIKQQLSAQQAETLLIDHTLGDGQHTTLVNDLGCELKDYSGLILEIFARRAITATSKLQVELAQEIYRRSKLKGAWQHLERQRGALGATGGPGERQLEIDRRESARKINTLRNKLDKLVKHTKRIAERRQSKIPTIAIVGYTNAGKSTLFARLTRAKVKASAQVFETLSTTSRRMFLDTGQFAVISDTVGFIRNLPHELVTSFRSTLHEATVADLIAIVVDGSDPECADKLDTVEQTLATIGAQDIPQLLICNKADLGKSTLLDFPCGKIGTVNISARSGYGVSELRTHLSQYFSLHRVHNWLVPVCHH